MNFYNASHYIWQRVLLCKCQHRFFFDEIFKCFLFALFLVEFPLQQPLIYFFHILTRNKKPTNCAVIVIFNNPTQFYWLKELTLYKKRLRTKQIVYKIAKSSPAGRLLYFLIHYHFASEKQEKYMPNENKFTGYFHIKLNFWKERVVFK